MAAAVRKSSARNDALGIFRASLQAADPIEAVRRFLQRDGATLTAGRRHYALDRYERIWILGAGKASAAMARAAEDVVGARRIAGGLVLTKYGHGLALKRVRVHECGHPVPDESGVAGAQQLVEMARAAGERDLVILLISGGASALTPCPVEPITLAEKQQTTKLLLACGANIHEINTLRKHLSALKGGHLARHAAPATLITLMLSDVIGDPMDVIGSGPTVPDPSTFAAARAILTKYDLTARLPESVAERLAENADAEETPKPGDPAFARAQNLIVGSNRLAVDAAAAEAKRRGYRPLVLSTFIEGETREIARMHAAIAREVLATQRPVRTPACILSGGETTVKLCSANGLGGRNQEFVLAAAIDLAGVDGVTVLSAGTDGTDGPTDAAGAIADGRTVERAAKLGLAAQAMLAANDSYHFFDPLGDLLRTGPTRTNVNDVRLLLIR
ncbi:MAG: glycerate kinase [Acidobacteria bacterium]|nr:glycerate kinase [Acidobacteriota bacterium]